MKRKDIPGILNALDEVSELKGVKFAFTVLKNRKIFETQIEEDKAIFEKILTPSDEFKEFETKRIELCIECSEKDENGSPVVENDQYKILDLNKFDNELNKLSKKHKEAIDARKKQIDDYNSLMEEDLILDFKKISINDLPNEVSEKQLRMLEFMIQMD